MPQQNGANNKTSSFSGQIIIPTGAIGDAASFATNISNSVANRVICYPFNLSTEMTVTKLAFQVTTADAGDSASIGVYSADGNTKLIDSGLISIATTGVKTATLGASVSLQAGTYIMATTQTATAGAARGAFSASANVVMNAWDVRWGIAANAATLGALPTTLGVISTSGVGPVIVLLSTL